MDARRSFRGGRYELFPPFSPKLSPLTPTLRNTGSIDGKVHVWDVAPPPEQRPPHYPQPGPYCTLFPIKSIDGHVGGPSRAVAFNPKTAMFASAGNDLVGLFELARAGDALLTLSFLLQAFWLPELAEEASEPAA